ncbi:MAG TPA: hypothetical protein VNV88_08435 [Candidatus Solibacter sp.]|jgi:hypothetical protein|nr:hypothetical protein [Candidatus Solibacter sp.]
MSHNALISAFWILSLVLNCGLVAVLMGKGSLRKFPFFGTYAIFTLFASGLLYLVQGFRVTYFYTYWICEGVSVILGFAVVYEVFGRLLTPYPALRRLALSIFQWSILVLVLMGCVVVYAQSGAQQNKFVAAVMVVEEATRIIEVGLLMFLFLFSTAFGLHWRQSVFGMALGLGIFATVELVGIAMRNYWGAAIHSSFAVVRAVAFNISLMVWAGYLLAREKETSPVEAAHRGQLEQWNQVLTEFIYQ